MRGYNQFHAGHRIDLAVLCQDTFRSCQKTGIEEDVRVIGIILNPASRHDEGIDFRGQLDEAFRLRSRNSDSDFAVFVHGQSGYAADVHLTEGKKPDGISDGVAVITPADHFKGVVDVFLKLVFIMGAPESALAGYYLVHFHDESSCEKIFMTRTGLLKNIGMLESIAKIRAKTYYYYMQLASSPRLIL